MKAAVLLDECHRRGIKVAYWAGKLRVAPAGVLPPDLKAELKAHKEEVVVLLHKSTRDFLPRPLGQEHNPEVWEVWMPLMHWLFENHVTAYDAICDSEDALNRLERKGIVSGPQYEGACHRLLTAFETGRKLKLSHGTKIWLH
jgi:hypothetical protein